MQHAEEIPMNMSAGAASKSAQKGAPAEPADRELVERCQRGQLEAHICSEADEE